MSVLTKLAAKVGVKVGPLLELMEDRIVVQPISEPEKERMLATPEGDKSLIIVSPGQAEPPNRGIVSAVGPGRTTEHGVLLPMKYKVGDTVLFGRYAGHELTVDGVKVLLIREPDVFARIR